MMSLRPMPRAFFRWMLPGLAGGLVVGWAGGWWVGRRQVEAGGRQLVFEGAGSVTAGPRVPAVPGSGGAGVGGAAAASGPGVVPVIEVGDSLEAAMKALLAIKDPAVRQAALQKFLVKLPVDRWPEFLAAMKGMGDMGQFDDEPGAVMAAFGVMEAVLSFMMQRSPEAVLSGAVEAGVAAAAFRVWAGRDVAAAMAYFEEHLSPLPADQQVEAAKGLARELVKSDPAAAFAWIKRLPKENQAQVAHGALQTLSHIDSQAALRFLVAEKDLPNREEFAHQMARGWAATEPEKALAWARGLPEDLTARAVEGAMRFLAEKDFAAAVRETAGLGPGQQDAALGALARSLRDEEPGRVAEVVRLVEAGVEGPGRAKAALNAVLVWTGQDAAAASAWVAVQPEGPTRDAAIQGFGYTAVVSKKDPEAGLEWTAVISGAAERGDWLRQNIRAWTDYDAAAARAWVQSSPRLSAEDRERLLPLTRK